MKIVNKIPKKHITMIPWCVDGSIIYEGCYRLVVSYGEWNKQ